MLRLLDEQNVKRAMSNFNMRPNTAVGAVWSAAPPDREQLASRRVAVGAAMHLHTGIGPPSRAGYRPKEPRGPIPAPRSASGWTLPLVMAIEKPASKPNQD